MVRKKHAFFSRMAKKIDATVAKQLCAHSAELQGQYWLSFCVLNVAKHILSVAWKFGAYSVRCDK